MGLIINNINSNIENGEWTMLFSNYSANIFSLTCVKATFTRIENIYTCSVLLAANIDFTQSQQAIFQFSLPFENFVENTCNGLGNFKSDQNINAIIPGTNVFQVNSTAYNTFDDNFTMIFQVTKQ